MRDGDYFLRSEWEELSVDQRTSVVVYLKMIGHFVYSGWDEFDVDYVDFPEKYITIAECGSESGLFSLTIFSRALNSAVVIYY